MLLLYAGEQLDDVQPTPESLMDSFPVIFVIAIGLYRWYFQPGGIPDGI